MDAGKTVVGSITTMLSYLKWGCEILLHSSFFHSHPHSHLLLLQHPTPAGGDGGDEEEAECAVCLCKIEGDDEEEVPELTCRHAFHKVCLDRWTQYSFFSRRRHPTCPLCRRSLTAGPEVLVFDYAGLVCSDDARQTWWLR